MEKTLVLIKPDAFGKKHSGDILKIYEDAGFRIVAAKVMKMTKEIAAKHYVEHIGRPYYESLVANCQAAVCPGKISARPCNRRENVVLYR